MRSTRHFCLLLTFAAFSAVAAVSQSSDPVAALKELLTADKIADAAKHYPVAVEEMVKPLKGDDKAEATKILLLKEKLGAVVVQLSNASDREQGEALEKNGDKRISLTVLNSFVSGGDALVVAQFNFSRDAGAKKFFFLHFEAGEWRLKSMGLWMEEENFESDKFMRVLLPIGRNEIAAEETLVEIQSALEDYGTTYPNAGLPSSLAPLSGPLPAPEPPEVTDKPNVPEVEPDTDGTDDSEEPPAASPVPPVFPEHAYLVDPVFMADPAIKDGYQFHYKLIDAGVGRKDEAQYQLTAIPVEFGKTGNRSYFIDQTAVIRFTRDHREANENDEPLNQDEREAWQFPVKVQRIIR